MQNQNPFLTNKRFSMPYISIPFEEIKLEHFLPAVIKGIEKAQARIELIKNSPNPPTFKEVVEGLEGCDFLLNHTMRVLDVLSLVKSSDMLINIQGKAQELYDGHMISVFTDKILFEKVNKIYQEKNLIGLSREESKLLQLMYDSFIDYGVHLKGDDKKRFEKITKRLSQLSIAFEKNGLAEDKDFSLHIKDASELEGLSEDTLRSLRGNAEKKDKEGYVFVMNRKEILLDILPFLKSRSLRKELYKAVVTKCANGGPTDNREIISEIANLRLEKAKLLGYERFSDVVLKDTMAKSTDKVLSFLEELSEKSFSKAQEEVKKVEQRAQKDEGEDFVLMPWDFSFYSERLKEEEYSFSQEEVKQYFNYPRVKNGIFVLINKLYKLTFEKIENVQTWHPDVEVYRVLDKDNSFIGLVYLDMFQRQGTKAGNAWMAELLEQENSDTSQEAHIQLCMNLNNPDANGDLPMTLDNVTTFLHEFGHVLHGLLSKVRYPSLSGTNVSRDFVELPSQFMEDFFYEDFFIKKVAKHNKTGEPMPEELFEKILKAKRYNKAYSLIGQVGYSKIDMAYNAMREKLSKDPIDFEKEVKDSIKLLPDPSDFKGGVSTSFAHIFSGGYAAGYYSYQWSDVLAADAFEYAKHHEFSEKIMDAFRRNILEKGGSIDPDNLYKRFRGKSAEVDTMLKRDGII